MSTILHVPFLKLLLQVYTLYNQLRPPNTALVPNTNCTEMYAARLCTTYLDSISLVSYIRSQARQHFLTQRETHITPLTSPILIRRRSIRHRRRLG